MRPRFIKDCQQVETQFTRDEWESFIECARDAFARGEFIHNEFYAKLEEHAGASDNDVLHAISTGSRLVAYRDEAGERVALWEPEGRNVVVVSTLDDGVITAYTAHGFEKTLAWRTDVRRLWWPA